VVLILASGRLCALTARFSELELGDVEEPGTAEAEKEKIVPADVVLTDVISPSDAKSEAEMTRRRPSKKLGFMLAAFFSKQSSSQVAVESMYFKYENSRND